MKANTHVNLVKLAICKTELLLPEWDISELTKKIIMIGAFEADCNPLRFVHPHYYQKSGEYILKKAESLFTESKISSLELGVIFHYLADFCCQAHINGNIGNIKEHMRYEKKLAEECCKRQIELKMSKVELPKPENTIDYIERMLKTYRETSPSMLKDLTTAVNITTALLFNLVQEINDYEFVNSQYQLNENEIYV